MLNCQLTELLTECGLDREIGHGASNINVEFNLVCLFPNFTEVVLVPILSSFFI